MSSAAATAIGAIVSKAAKWAGADLAREVKRLRYERDARTLTAAESEAEQFVNRLAQEDRQAIVNYAHTPAFEQLALQTMVHVHYERNRDLSDDFRSAIREQIRLGLRNRSSFAEERLLTATDAVFGLLLEHIATASMPLQRPPDAMQLAAGARIATTAVRNSKVLARIEHVTRTAGRAADYRRQVAALQSKIRFPHAGTEKPVAWDALYVDPELSGVGRDGWIPRTYQELASPGRRSVILGDPGAGKSTMAFHLAFLAATDRIEETVPFVVVLRDFLDALRNGNASLLDCLAATTNSPYGVALNSETVEYLLLNARCLVLVDGLDEVTEPGLRSRVADLVNAFAHLYPLVPMVATSRRVGYFDAPLDSTLFRVAAILRFDEQRIGEYARKWFAVVERADLVDGFLHESTSVEDLRRNPLMLSLLCAMYVSEQYLPRNRAQVYERCATMMFEKWDSIRGVEREGEFDGRVRGAVQELAWRLFETDAAPEIGAPAAVRILVGYLVSRHFDELDARKMATDVLDLCSNRAWVLSELGTDDGEPIYGFAHRTFLEYFVAERIVRTRVSPEAVWEVIAAHLGEPAWRVVIDLVLQLVDRNVDGGGDQLVEHALAAGGERSMMFVVDAAAAISLSPIATGSVVEWAAGRALSRTVAERTPYTPPPRPDPVSLDDLPLKQLAGESLNGNLPRISRAVVRILDERTAAGDETAAFLGVHLGTIAPATRRFSRETWAKAEAEFTGKWSADQRVQAWGGLRVATTGWTADRVDRVFLSAGAYAFFVHRNFLGVLLPPVVFGLLCATAPDDPAAVRLYQRLVSQPTTWCPARPAPTGDGELAALLSRELTTARLATPLGCVLALPYLEDLTDRTTSMPLEPGVLGRELIELRRSGTGRRAAGRALRHVDGDERVAGFLAGWVARDFSVLAR